MKRRITMSLRIHPTRRRHILARLCLMALAAWLVLPGSARAVDGEAPPAGGGLPSPSPLPQVHATVEDEQGRALGLAVQPNDLSGTGASAKVSFGRVGGNFFGFATITWSFINVNTRVFMACNEGGFYNGAVFTLHNIIPVTGAVHGLLQVQANYNPTLVCDVLAIK
jgi:hypothetical protein